MSFSTLPSIMSIYHILIKYNTNFKNITLYVTLYTITVIYKFNFSLNMVLNNNHNKKQRVYIKYF